MTKAKKIFVNARFLSQALTGVQRYAFECCVQMKKMDAEIIFLSPENILHHEWSKLLDVKVIGNRVGHLWEQIDLPLYLIRKTNYVLFNPCNTAPLLLAYNFITIHDLSFKLYKENNSFWFRTWYSFLIPKVIHRAKHLFTVSETIQKQICSAYSVEANKISITYNGIAFNFESQSKSEIKKDKMILVVGSISKRKNITLLMQAFLDSPLKNEYKLVIAGSYQAIFSEVTLIEHPQIVMETALSDKELIQYYQRSEIAVSLSSYEGFGIPVLEALFYRCKVLCANIETYHELFEDYVYFCDHFDKQNIISMLTMIANNHNQKSIDIKFLQEKFSFSKSAHEILEMIQNKSK
jgi:glycosyltransferase involved in cell wall biosynthesis